MPLIINGRLIEQLTGFTKIYTLIPKNNNLPIILNFGELHENIKYPCTDTDSATLVEFLEELNILASKFHVEIYSEDFLNYGLLELSKKKNVTLKEWNTEIERATEEEIMNHYGTLGVVTNQDNVLSCYYKNLRIKKQIFRKKCKYPNIIWQFSDARKTFRARKTNSVFTIEHITDFTNNLEWLINQFAFTDDSYNRNYPKVLNPPSLTTQEEKYKFINKTINKLYAHSSYSNIINESILINMLQLIIDFHENPEAAANTIKDISIIQKQLNKQKFDSKINLHSHILTYINYILGQYEHTPVFNSYINVIKSLINYLNDKTDENCQLLIDYVYILIYIKPLKFHKYYNIDDTDVQLIVAPSSIILDIYFILRILKHPKKDLVCNISGSGHTDNITYFLTNILNIYNSYEYPNIHKQCTHFNTLINLNQLLLKKTKIPSSLINTPLEIESLSSQSRLESELVSNQFNLESESLSKQLSGSNGGKPYTKKRKILRKKNKFFCNTKKY